MPQTSAFGASLLLNLEVVFTALLAWFVFREIFDSRIAWGMELACGANHSETIRRMKIGLELLDSSKKLRK